MSYDYPWANVETWKEKKAREEREEQEKQNKAREEGELNNFQKAYNRYVSDMNRIGLTPTSFDTFYAQNKGKNPNDIEGMLAGFYESVIFPEAARYYNTKVKEAADLTGTPYTGSNLKKENYREEGGAEWRGQGANTVLDKISGIMSDAKNLSTAAEDTKKLEEKKKAEKYVFTPSELMKQEEARLKAEVDVPDAVRPEYSYDPSLSQKYFNQLSESEKAGTEKAVRTVNEQANLVNPYATGSGRQIKSIAGMLDKITADQQARAFALGLNEYDRKYSGQYADYDKSQAKKTAARQGLLGLANYYDTMNTAGSDKEAQTAWNKFLLNVQAGKDALQQAAEERRYNRENELLMKAAELNKPKEQEWWQPFVGAAIGGLTGGIGGGLAGGVANIVSAKPWGYNPWEKYLSKL